MSSVPLNLGPNPRRRESFSNSYKPFEGAAGAHPDGRPLATNLVVENVTIVEDDAVVEDDEVGAAPPQPPRAFVRGNRSFSQSHHTESPAHAQAQHIPGKDARGLGQTNGTKTSGHTTTNGQSTSPEMAKSPQEGGWWYGGIKEF